MATQTYKRAEIEWENTLSFQFNKFISTNIFLYPRFDDARGRDSKHGYWEFKEIRFNWICLLVLSTFS